MMLRRKAMKSKSLPNPLFASCDGWRKEKMHVFGVGKVFSQKADAICGLESRPAGGSGGNWI
jgi:hypothetical protein